VLGDISDNEKDARYVLENMVGNLIMVMGKGENSEWGGDNGARRILYGIMLETLTSKGNEVGRLSRDHSIIVQDDEWRTARERNLL